MSADVRKTVDGAISLVGGAQSVVSLIAGQLVEYSDALRIVETSLNEACIALIELVDDWQAA